MYKLPKVLLLLLIFQKTIEWHPTGHFMVARIAEMEIQRQKPSLLPALNKILGVLKEYTKENEHTFVESACYPDDIKYISWKLFNKWHFYDQPIILDKKFKPLIEKQKTEEQNLVWAINEAKNTLRNTKSSAVDDYLGKSFSLRYLIHLIGDIHQPLHNGALYNDQFKKGDTGGNAFKIVYPGSDGNLHSFWDKTLKVYKDLRAPLNNNDWKKLTTYCNDLVLEYPRSFFKDRLKENSVREWQKEGNDFAKKNAYPGLVPGGIVPESYVKKNTPIIKQQLAIGGYRLADVLLYIFKDPDTLKEHVKGGKDKVEGTNEDVSMVSQTQEENDENKTIVENEPESMSVEELEVPSHILDKIKPKTRQKKNKKRRDSQSWEPNADDHRYYKEDQRYYQNNKKYNALRRPTNAMNDESMDVDEKVTKYILKGSGADVDGHLFIIAGLFYSFALLF